MAKQSDKLAGAAKAENAGSALSGLFAEENEFDRRALWRIGSWGAAAVGAVTVAVMSNHLSLGLKHDQVAAADIARQAQQIQSLTKESQNETRRLASAIETLNSDRDRLFSRVTVIEQGLDSVTGALAKQATPAPQASAAAAQPTATTPGAPPTAQQIAAVQTTAPAPVPAPVATTAALSGDRPRADTGKIDAVKTDAAGPVAAANGSAASAAPATAVTAASVPASPAAAASLMAKSMTGPPGQAAPRLVETARTADTRTADTRTADTKTPDAKGTDNMASDAKTADGKAPEIKAPEIKAPETAMAEAKVDAKVDPNKAESKPSEPGPAAASEVVASANAMAEPEAAVANVAVNRTEFAVDLGSANSLGGLRAIWRSVRHLNGELGALNPIVVIREGHTGLGMQLHLAAGPLKDAAAVAKICAVLAETRRTCETTVYDGQRLAMKTEETIRAAAGDLRSEARSEAHPEPKPGTAEGKADARSEPKSRRNWSRHAKREEPPPPPPPPPPQPAPTSTFSALFGRK